MTSHVIAYQSLELLFGTHTFHFNCLFEDINWVFMQIRCLPRVLIDQSETFFVIILNLDQCCVKSSIFSSGWVVLVEGLTRNVITNCMKLFPIWTSSSGDVVYNISYLELWRPS